jgi:hypothetical protein
MALATARATPTRARAALPSLVLDTVYSDTVAQVLGTLSTTLLQKFDDCLKVGLGLL